MCRDTKLLLKSQGNVRTVSFKDVKAETVAITLNSLKVWDTAKNDQYLL